MKLLLFLALSVIPLDAQPVEKIVTAARAQVGVTLSYDPAYVSLAYPGGDVPREKGVCTDVVIRALRDGLSEDLQALVHEDMKANFSVYPKIWGLKTTDKNIDHRRVPNLQTYFKRRGFSLPLSTDRNPQRFQAGDIVTVMLPPSLPHIMIISDRKASDGTPLVIHNVGGGAREEDFLFLYPHTGHYRVK